MKRVSSERSLRRSRRPFHIKAEWISFAIAALIVAVLIGLILLVWVTQDDEPPILAVTPQTEAVRQARGFYYVPFTVTNEGGGTVESVQVIGELLINGEVEESGEQQIDFLSSGEKEEGAFIFSRDPEQGELVIRVGSYKLP